MAAPGEDRVDALRPAAPEREGFRTNEFGKARPAHRPGIHRAARSSPSMAIRDAGLVTEIAHAHKIDLGVYGAGRLEDVETS